MADAGEARYPWIVEAALKNRYKQFVIDGEAVVLGIDGVADFDALHSRKHDHEVKLYAEERKSPRARWMESMTWDRLCATTETTIRATLNPQTKLQGLGFSSPQSLQSRIPPHPQNRLPINRLGLVHGRLS